MMVHMQTRFAGLVGISKEATQAVESAKGQQARAVSSLLNQYRWVEHFSHEPALTSACTAAGMCWHGWETT